MREHRVCARTLMMQLPGFICGTACCARLIIPTIFTRNVLVIRSRPIFVKSSHGVALRTATRHLCLDLLDARVVD